MLNYEKESKFLQIKLTLKEFWVKNKVKIIIWSVIIFIALLTGIFTSLKLYKIDKDLDLDNFNIKSIISGEVGSFKYFVLRIISTIVVCALLYLFSLNKFINIFGFALLVYRAYLVTLNCSIILIKLGISGIVTAFVIILPCHLLMLGLLSGIFCMFIAISKQKRSCGYIDRESWKNILILLGLMLIVNIIEILLFLILSPKTILII